MRNMELLFYIWLYDNYRLFELPWNSPCTWILTMFGVDLAKVHIKDEGSTTTVHSGASWRLSAYQV